MSQRHLDQLSAIDASFLHQEGASAHMHIGGVAVLTGPPPDFQDIRELIRSRLHRVPRYRQKLAVPPASLGRQRWADDPHFNLDYHVRHTGLPAPGDMERLQRLVARIFSQRLDRTKPLWELWVVEGLDGGRWAIISKTHHALVDGLSGVDLVTTLFDLTPEPPAPEPPDPWQPHPEPSAAQLVAGALTGAAGRVLGVPQHVAAAAARPSEALEGLREAGVGVAEVARNLFGPQPANPLNVPIGPHRRFEVVSARLEDFKAVKNTLGGTVNDVVLAVVAGALQRFLHERGVRTAGVRLRACVPVSVRTPGQQGAMGNKLAQVIAPLPVDVGDPVERLAAVRRVMDGIKDSKQALGAEVLAGAQDFAPPTILAQASRLNFSNRLYNLLVTNIPGPQFPIYVLGRELGALYPVAFLAGERALAVAVISYNGALNFGLLGDLDALPDLSVIADGIEDSLAELVALAAPPAGGRRKRSRAAAR